ncbi:hypothetical protein AMS68_003322 [Peltaster fructicola]|uniref:AMP-dependent synthetase/ligase domain-containing protein n=1 Tax=Peltaster fructicola TaxID=286661 RepID=A0A6H0XT32_9PEZI|nr:hypothetical protein AMS68_003322 [Peltaster fructicola]
MGVSNVLPDVLWRPKAPESTSMSIYRQHINQKYNTNLKDTQQLVQWSCDNPQDFWLDVYAYLKLTPSMPSCITRAYDDTAPMSSNPLFFDGLMINYAENALFANPDPDAVALIGVREDHDLTKEDGEIITWRQFRERVRIAASALRRSGIKKGDRVAALVATSVVAMVLYHATVSIGAIFTCINPDLGLEGCVSRLQQVTPSVIFADDATLYKGKMVSTSKKLSGIMEMLPSRPSLYVVPVSAEQSSWPSINAFLEMANPDDELTFTRVSFNDPLFICYSSGTTGAPKCIVHRHGLILQLKKISILHNTLTPKDVVLQYSSTSWIVFYIMCGNFATGTTTICYNGSPLYPSTTQLLRLAEKYKVTYFGTSPRYLLEVETSGCIPQRDFDLSSLRIVYTTGAALSIEQYRWFHRAFPPKVQLSNTAGGTDTATSHMALDPSGPVYAGEMQIRALGMEIDVADPQAGHSIMHTGEPGEMVIRKPFPSMPCFFWGDKDGSRYRASYFERFQDVDVWAQHDWLSQNPRTGGFIMSGRSDGVLNPSGIRFGSSEIYAIVEAPTFTNRILDSLCVGRRRPQDRDEEVFLFLVMKPGYALSAKLRQELRLAIRNALSPRHVPKYIIQVPAIPVTINGKKIEIAIKQTLSGKNVKPSATVANPTSIEHFKRYRDIDSEPRGANL